MSALSSSPGYSYTLDVTDAAQVNISVRTYCSRVEIWEQSNAVGYPRQFLVLLPSAGSSQIVLQRASLYPFMGPYRPSDIAGTVELVSAGGDSSKFSVREIA